MDRYGAGLRLAPVDGTLGLQRIGAGVQAGAGLATLLGLKQLADSYAAIEAFGSSLRLDLDLVGRAFGGVTSFFENFLPSNWEGVTQAEELRRFMEAGLPLAWVPRIDIVREVRECSTPTDALRMLVDRRDAVVLDVQLSSEEVSHPDLQRHAQWIRECVEDLRDGRHASAQALASTVISDLLVSEYRWAHLSAAARACAPVENPRDQPLPEWRRQIVLAPVRTALQKYSPNDPSSIPRSYSRHASVHSSSGVQLTVPNALVAIMLAASLLREAAHRRENRARAAGSAELRQLS